LALLSTSQLGLIVCTMSVCGQHVYFKFVNTFQRLRIATPNLISHFSRGMAGSCFLSGSACSWTVPERRSFHLRDMGTCS
jgi:hypothetical protein